MTNTYRSRDSKNKLKAGPYATVHNENGKWVRRLTDEGKGIVADYLAKYPNPEIILTVNPKGNWLLRYANKVFGFEEVHCIAIEAVACSVARWDPSRCSISNVVSWGVYGAIRRALHNNMRINGGSVRSLSECIGNKTPTPLYNPIARYHSIDGEIDMDEILKRANLTQEESGALSASLSGGRWWDCGHPKRQRNVCPKCLLAARAKIVNAIREISPETVPDVDFSEYSVKKIAVDNFGRPHTCSPTSRRVIRKKIERGD